MFCSNNFTGWQVAGLDWRCMHRTQGSLCLSYSFTRNLIIYCIYYIHIIFDWCLCMTAARCILIVIEVLIVWSVNICKVLKIYDLQSPNPSCWKNEFHPTMTHHTSKFGHFGRRWNNWPVPCNKAANRLSSPANQDGKRIFFEVGTVSSKQQRGVSPSQPANFFLKFLGLNGLKFTISVVIFGGSRNIQILKKLKGTIPRLNDDRPQKIMR